MNNYLLLDGARLEAELKEAKALNQAQLSLYRGRAEEDLDDVAPHLFTLPHRSEFESWFFTQGWGRSCGVIATSALPLEETCRHFRKFLLVKTEDDEELYFRFYDPRVLRVFLPTCDKKQLEEFFGPIEYFMCEDEDEHYGLVFSLNDRLNVQKVDRDHIGEHIKNIQSSKNRLLWT